MRIIFFLATAFAMTISGCESVPEEPLPQTPKPPAGASVAEIRKIKPVAPPRNPYTVINGPRYSNASTLVDTETGCQYTVRTIRLAGVTITPRNKLDKYQPRQICSDKRSSKDLFITLAGGEATSFEAHVTRDSETGCQEIVVTRDGEAISATPRMRDNGRRIVQICDHTGAL